MILFLLSCLRSPEKLTLCMFVISPTTRSCQYKWGDEMTIENRSQDGNRVVFHPVLPSPRHTPAIASVPWFRAYSFAGNRSMPQASPASARRWSHQSRLVHSVDAVFLSRLGRSRVSSVSAGLLFAYSAS